MAKKSRYLGYIEGYGNLNDIHKTRKRYSKEKSLTKKLNQYKKEVKKNG